MIPPYLDQQELQLLDGFPQIMELPQPHLPISFYLHALYEKLPFTDGGLVDYSGCICSRK